MTTVEVVQPSDDENSEDEDSDEGVFPFYPSFFHHLFHAHAGADSSEGSSEED